MREVDRRGASAGRGYGRMSGEGAELLLVGGGLANLLLAWRLSEQRPDVCFTLVEAGREVGGEHTWSFHESDLDPASRGWVPPLARGSWEGYDVRFPGHARTLPGRYLSIASADLRERAMARFGARVRVGTAVRSVSATGVVLDDGTTLTAAAAVDGRGWSAVPALDLGFQNFLGLDVELAEPHGLGRPVIMDATVSQRGGYRFVYLLPWSERTVLVEPTAYADSPVLDEAAFRADAEGYVAARGWRVRRVVREERGSLPIPLAGRFADLPAEAGVPTVGVRAGLFHAGTGYSLPVAARVADLVAASRDLSAETLAPRLRRFAAAHWAGQRYFRLLNRMLFRAADPAARYRVLERFYRLSPELVARFYAGRLRASDRLRILAGRPPVPLGRAVGAAFLGRGR